MTHAICDGCWIEREVVAYVKEHPQTDVDLDDIPIRLPYRLKYAKEETCCFCGTRHVSGIYLREDSSKLQCQHA